MEDNDEELKRQIATAYDNLRRNELYVRTNIENHTARFAELGLNGHNFYLKDETKQESGSFKFRGIVNQMKNLFDSEKDISKLRLLTFSAGNYGRIFAKLCSKMAIKGLVIMPDFAPLERVAFIESQGVRTERHTTKDIQPALDNYVNNEDYIYLHPFADRHLIFGHASFGLEILEDIPDVDVAVIGCGGGGILSGTALALKLFGRPDCLIYGVEPETANTMHMSFRAGAACTKPDAKSVASGLSPPFAGKINYEVCKKYVNDIILVTEDEILKSMVTLHELGIMAEPSGSAALAAVMFHKIPALENSTTPLNVLIAVTGGNCSQTDLEYVRVHK